MPENLAGPRLKPDLADQHSRPTCLRAGVAHAGIAGVTRATHLSGFFVPPAQDWQCCEKTEGTRDGSRRILASHFEAASDRGNSSAHFVDARLSTRVIAERHLIRPRRCRAMPDRAILAT
ncbi:hypothetical protein [Pandoraea pnomenusa]|uniref:hypothetical protein n=1 Tax=Pandoraea pnomenusa TaxID=93220 RepID=UPI0007BCBD66|nr:hypothetical protein [Pandoraea pnomenusa]ANC43820.1 hypothetical protein A6P55_05795 [Pandoraea pnomenusa]